MTLHVLRKSLALSIHHPFTVTAKFEAWSSGRGQESAGGQLRLGEGTRIHLGRVLFQVSNGTKRAEINWSWADHGCLTNYYTYIHTVLEEQSGLFKHQILQVPRQWAGGDQSVSQEQLHLWHTLNALGRWFYWVARGQDCHKTIIRRFTVAHRLQAAKKCSLWHGVWCVPYSAARICTGPLWPTKRNRPILNMILCTNSPEHA